MSLTHKTLNSSERKLPKTLILIVDITTPGGVSNYYRTLKLDDQQNIEYFTVTRGIAQPAFIAIMRLLAKYTIFIYKLIKDRFKVVIINPSLDLGKSFHRDMVFIIIAKLFGRKALVFFRGWFDPYEELIRHSRFKLFLFRISYARADKYIVLGDIFRKKLIGLGVPSGTEFNIETTVADSTYVKELDLDRKFLTFKEKVNFLFLSRIEHDKGIYIAINAYAEYSVKHPGRRSSLTIAGDGPDLSAVKKYVKDSNISDIVFLGNVSADSKKKVLLDSHIMIFPSFTEGLPNCILEGMLYGMPIISRITGGIPEVVHQNINGYLSDSFDPLIFADFLSVISSDNELYFRIARENHNTAMERYTVEKVKERILTIIEKADL